MLIKQADAVKPSEITSQNDYLNRRQFMRDTVLSAIAIGSPGLISSPAFAGTKLEYVTTNAYGLDEPLTPYDDITSYNNFYEFGTDKGDPKSHSKMFKPKPWSLSVSGECEMPGTYGLEDFMSPHQLEERIYRLRCVEAWSMVVPWVGVPLGPVLSRFKPTSKARYVAFKTVFRPEEMPGQTRSVLDWPYVEGLRIDEAMNELSLLAVGIYGEELPNQNGAPIRLVVPWKYGFKSIKSVVSIEFTEQQPPTSWSTANGREYGFYSNVNPNVNHPRWSQKKERRIGKLFKQPTLVFNGYGEQVRHLYDGMDLTKFY